MNKNKRNKKKQVYNDFSNIETREEESLIRVAENDNQLKNQWNQQQQVRKIDKIEEEEDEDHPEEEVDLENENDKKKLQENKNHDKLTEIINSLFLKNKINMKNAFDVPFPKVKHISVFQKIEDNQAWKKLSSTLESGAKIYGYRVDAICQDTYKILGGLSRTEIEDVAKALNEVIEKEDEQEEEANISQKQRKDFNGEKTLEQKLQNINAANYDLEFDVDPLFQKTSAKFDEEGAKGILLNNLFIDENLQIIFDSTATTNDKPFSKEGKSSSLMKNKENHYNSYAQVVDKKHKVSSKTLFKSKFLNKIQEFIEELSKDSKELLIKEFVSKVIINTFINQATLQMTFSNKNANNLEILNEEDNEHNDQQIQDELNQLLDNELTEYPNNNEQPIEEIMAQQINDDGLIGQEIYFDQNSINSGDQFGNNNQFVYLEDEDNSQLPKQQITKQLINMNNIDEKILQIGSGYTFSQVFDSENWLGPETWNANENKKPKKKIAQQQKKAKTQNVFEFKFDPNRKLNMNQVFEKRNTKIINLQIPEGQIQHYHLLPFDARIDPRRHCSLFQIDIYRNQSQLYKSNQEQQLTIQDINQIKLLNEEEYQQQDQQLMDDDMGNDFLMMEQMNTQAAIKGDLPKGQIPIKELKKRVWMQIYQNLQPKPQSSEMIIEKEFDKITNSNENHIKIQEESKYLKFSDVLCQIPDIVRTHNVSLQSTFVTMLHLANEQNLSLLNKDNSGLDFLICKECV